MRDLIRKWRIFATSSAYAIYLATSFFVVVLVFCIGVVFGVLPKIEGIEADSILGRVGMVLAAVSYFLLVPLSLIFLWGLVPVTSYIGFLTGNPGPMFISAVVLLVYKNSTYEKVEWLIVSLVIILTIMLGFRWFTLLSKKTDW